VRRALGAGPPLSNSHQEDRVNAPYVIWKQKERPLASLDGALVGKASITPGTGRSVPVDRNSNSRQYADNQQGDHYFNQSKAFTGSWITDKTNPPGESE